MTQKRPSAPSSSPPTPLNTHQAPALLCTTSAQVTAPCALCSILGLQIRKHSTALIYDIAANQSHMTQDFRQQLLLSL